MKNKLILISSVLITMLSLAYAYKQKIRADEFEAIALRNEQTAMEMAKEAEQNMIMAMEQRTIAQQIAQEAMNQNRLLVEELKKKK